MKRIDPDLRYTISVILTEHPELIRALRRRYATEDMWLYCIDQEPSIFQYCEKPSLQLCDYALRADGMNIRYIHPKRVDWDPQYYQFCVLAVLCTPRAITVIPAPYRTEELSEKALRGDPSLLTDLSSDVSFKCLQRHILEYPSHIQYIKHPDEDLKLLAIHKDPMCALLIPKEEWTRDMKTQMEREHPDIYRSMSLD